MKKNLKRVLTGLLAFALIFSAITPPGPSVQAEESGTEYEIYPQPHQMLYQDGEYIIRPEVNVIFEEGIDTATRNRMDEVLAIKDKTVTNDQTEKAEGKTNILVGIYQSGGYVDKYVTEKYGADADLFAHYGSYLLVSDNDEIVILGRDTDAAFYGITSLKHIFNQMDGSTIRNFTMKDYADVNIRGFIEGYYGIPWSNEDRMSLMRFGGDFKMTSYVFAPKDDEYHKGKWREPYPAEELAAIKEMVAVGNASKCKFVWTAHPFMGGFDQNNADAEIEALLAKFEQLYSAGVRQFGVLGDDVGSLPRSIVIQMMNEVSDWAKAKGDVYDTVFCPGGYNDSWQGDYSELNEYDAGFPDDVQIFWTGQAVCKPIEQTTLTNFRTKNLAEGQDQRRAPLFWLNWPVNDINHGRMLMGKGSLLHTDVNVNDLNGAVTNPMQEAEPSKVAIFAVADYSWNVAAFDDDTSWADSFKYIEPNATEELHTLAKHMSNPQPNGHGLVLAESEELQPLLEEFETALQGGESVQEVGQRVIAEMDVIINACDGFHAKSTNEEMKEDLLPFTNSLKALCESIRSFAAAKIAIENGDMLSAFNSYTNGQTALASSKAFTKPMLNGTTTVSPGSTYLIPLGDTLQELLSGPINDYIAGGEGGLTLTAESSFSSFYAGKLENIIDGDNETHVWYGGYEAVGQYFQVNLSQPSTVYGIHIANGTTSKKTDTFGNAKLVYKVDGSEEWTELGTYSEYPETVDKSNIQLENVVAVRYECTEPGSGNKWPAMREFEIATQPEAAVEFTKEVIHTTDGWSISDAAKANIVDEDLSTSGHFNVRQSESENTNTTIEGDYVGVKLSQPIVLGKISIVQGLHDTHGDYFKNCDLEWSMDGENWSKIETFTDKRTIEIDVSDRDITAQYVRLKNNVTQGTWIAMREFDVDAKVFFNAKAYTNAENYMNIGAKVLDDRGELEPTKDITLAKDEYIGIKLDRVHELKTVEQNLTNAGNLTLETSVNGYEWTEYNEDETVNARYIRLINKTDAEVTFDVASFVVTTNEFAEKSMASTTFNGIENPMNVFDGNRTTETYYKNSQTQGYNVVYDLGQIIRMDSFKAVCLDSSTDFPRHGKFSVSTDGTNWTDIMTIGKQDGPNDGEAENTDNINDVFPLHETSYNAKAAEESAMGVDARYLKFEVTRTKVGANKWVRFSELEINNGEYTPTVNNPTFGSDCGDTQEGKFEYLVDGDLATSYIPDSDNGYINYTVSDNNQVNKIKIVQSADPISNATVSARIVSNGKIRTVANEWVTLGTLSQTVNEFLMPEDTELLDVKIEWNGLTPKISEMMLSSDAYEAANKTELEKLLDETVDTSKWTKDSIAAYEAALEAGEKIYNSEFPSQASVDSAKDAIVNAKTNPLLKGDISVLEAALENAPTDSANYTARTWRVYSNAVSAVEAAIKNEDNTSEADVTKLIADLDAAKDALVYNPSNMEEATLDMEAANEFIGNVTTPERAYTTASWSAYTTAKAAVDTLIEQNKTTPVHPAEFRAALDTLDKAKTDLVSVTGLVEAIDEFAAEDPALYTEASYNAYKAEVEKAKALLANGSDEQIKDALEAIKEAKGKLAPAEKPLAQDLQKLYDALKAENSADYTADSYKVLDAALAKLNGKDFHAMSENELKEEIAALTEAKHQLVSVKALNEVIARANNVNAGLYTTDSYNKLQKAVKDAQNELVSGTETTVNDAVTAVDKAIRALVTRANAEEMKAYIEGIVLAEEGKYTKESYAAYKKAYEELTGALANADNVSQEEYLKLRNAYEKAFEDLVLKETKPSDPEQKPENKPEQKPDDKPDNKTQDKNTVKTGDNTGMALPVILIILSAVAAGFVVVYRKRRNV